MPAHIVLRDIHKRFANVVACEGVTFPIVGGEIHGLLGENGAGKSTLMNILYGLLPPDAGTIEIDGEPVHLDSPRTARDHGIGMVHQHFMLVPDMTVAENIALGQRVRRRFRSDLSAVETEVSALSRRYRLQVDPRARIEDLSVGVQQRVEILKLLYRGAEVMILDEPTAVLSPPEWDELRGILQSLAAEGKAIVLITHKLDEVQEAAHRCTVMRDGEVVGTVPAGEADNRTLARMMVGRDVMLNMERILVEVGDPVLQVQNLELTDNRGVRLLDSVSFEVRGGEVLGIAGVDGNGQHELIEVLTGMQAPDGGVIRLNGQSFDRLTPRIFTKKSGGVIPDDRRRTATALSMTIAENLVLKDYLDEPFCKYGVLNLAAVNDHAVDLVNRYGVRAASVHARLAQLSGGNQQKVVLARELHRTPDLLIAGQPTRGLDVGAMEAVYESLADHKRRGGATLLISTELEEVLSLSDRIGVMVRGRLLELVDADSADVERIGLLMAGSNA